MSLSSTAFHNPHFYYDSDNNLLSVNNVEPFVNGEINEDINACKNCFGCPLINIIRDKYEYKNFDGLPLGTGCAEFMSKKIIYKNKNEKIKINIDRTEYIIDGRIVSKSTRTKKSFRIFTNIDKSIEYIHKLIEKTRLNNKQKISIVTSATDKTLKNIDLRINKIDVPVKCKSWKSYCLYIKTVYKSRFKETKEKLNSLVSLPYSSKKKEVIELIKNSGFASAYEKSGSLEMFMCEYCPETQSIDTLIERILLI